MDGQQKIIDKILSDAKHDAGEMLSEALKKAEALVAAKQSEADAEYDLSVEEARKAGEEVVRRRLTVADLEVKKLLLSAKKQAVDEAFEESLKKLLALPKEEYTALVGSMIASAADDGDVVVISENDKNVLTKAVFDKISAKIGKKLTLSDTFGNFKGGVMLLGKGVDKNLTFESELALLRDEVEPEVAKIMFSNGKKS
ncbi:v-type proton ATPase subunit E [Faecalibacterium sp. CAG:1138]|nr:v-type proton ATPase subunit E [Faecalibacterium sp. CAG:1138]